MRPAPFPASEPKPFIPQPGTSGGGPVRPAPFPIPEPLTDQFKSARKLNLGFLSQKEAPAVTSTEAQLELEQTAALSIQSAEENMPVTPTDTPPVASYQEAAGAGEAQSETSVGGQATSTPLEDEAPALDASKEEDRRTGIFIFPASATGKTKEGQPNWAEMPNPKPATESEIEDAIDDDSKVIVFSMAMKPPTGDLPSVWAWRR